MIYKTVTASALLLLTACSSTKQKIHQNHQKSNSPSPTATYVSARSDLVPANTISSSHNKCVDNFNFLRSAGSADYTPYSHAYGKISRGFAFLNTNKNIMGEDARDVYSLKLDEKLDTLCNRVDYSGYQVIKNKISELQGI